MINDQQILNPRIWANCWEKMLCEIKLFVELEKGDGVASGYELFPVIHPIPHHHSSTLPSWTQDAQSLLHMRPWLLRGRLFDKVAGMSLQHVVDLTGREGGGSSVLAFQIWCGVVGKGQGLGWRKNCLASDSRFEMVIPLYQSIGNEAQKLLILRRSEECVIGHVTTYKRGHLEAFNIPDLIECEIRGLCSNLIWNVHLW